MNEDNGMSKKPKHIYKTDSCSGCGAVIVDDYTEIAMTSVDGTEVKHIALCPRCNEAAKNYGVI